MRNGVIVPDRLRNFSVDLDEIWYFWGLH